MEVLKNEIKCHEPSLTMNILIYVYTVLYVPALTSTIMSHKIALKRYKNTCICCVFERRAAGDRYRRGGGFTTVVFCVAISPVVSPVEYIQTACFGYCLLGYLCLLACFLHLVLVLFPSCLTVSPRLTLSSCVS